jgi:YVTN family beta-propeller protein
MRICSACILILMALTCHPMIAQNDFQGAPASEGKRVLMPYNRSVHSAGKVIRFGNPELENHTLDVALMPDKRFLVLEDRYGIAVLDRKLNRLVDRWTFHQEEKFRHLMSTFSGIKTFEFQGETYLVWGAASSGRVTSGILIARWKNGKITTPELLSLPVQAPSPNALPNEIEVNIESGECYLYVVLNGNEALTKIRFRDRAIIWSVETGIAPFGVKIAQNKAFVTNWGGPKPSDQNLETAGVPWGAAYTEPRTGAISKGTVSVYDLDAGRLLAEIQVGLHPNVMALSPDQQTLYVANGNSDLVTVIAVATHHVLQQIPVGLYQEKAGLVGSSPNGLALDSLGQTLYVSNGLDHAVAVVQLSAVPKLQGFIPTEAYPSGLICVDNTLYVANLEAIGADVFSKEPATEIEYPQIDTATFKGAYNSHKQYASLSIIPIPNPRKLAQYTKKVKEMGQTRLADRTSDLPRPNVAPRPVPERIGEPSVFKHVLYIIKENRTYDQVYGDLPVGRGMPSLCIFGDSVTPNQHKLALQYALLDNYHVSGKSSAEGHQWTDAGIVSDYVQKNVRAWFRSYPHRQYDAMVYTKEGFIWNHALDHGKSVRIYGEACFMEFDESKNWSDIYQQYLKKEPFVFKNTSTITRVRPILSQNFPGYDDAKINDQLRADAFIKELKAYEAMPGDSLPALMVMALPNDHTAGTSEGYPTPRAMVADNDLALGKIIEAVSKSRFWASTVIFVTEDDAQNGWDHRSAYRCGALVVSPYSQSKGIVRSYYNQTSMLRTIEQILGLPPMNTIDATARPMFDCFNNHPQPGIYTALANRIPLNEMNLSHSLLTGKALFYAQKSAENTAEGVDTGNDDLMNRVLWFYAKGEAPYPER